MQIHNKNNSADLANRLEQARIEQGTQTDSSNKRHRTFKNIDPSLGHFDEDRGGFVNDADNHGFKG